MSIVVEFANRPQLLEAVKTLPEELGPTVNFKHGELWFIRRNGSLIPRTYAMYGYNQHSERFETEHIQFPKPPTKEEAENMLQILSKGIIPEGIIVSTLGGGKHFIELFREKLLPELLHGKYQIESVKLTQLVPESINGEGWGPREWGIGTMNLVVRGNTVEDLDTRFAIEPIMRIRRGVVGGWFNRMLESNRETFLYAKAS